MKYFGLLLSFVFVVNFFPLLAQDQKKENDVLQELRIKIALEKKFTKSISDQVNQYHQKYYDYRKTDFSNVENRTGKYITKVNQTRASKLSAYEQLAAEHNYWRAKRQELTYKLAFYQGQDVSLMDEWYNEMKNDIVYIVKNIDWKAVFKPILECFSEMDLEKCKDIQGIIKNLVIESIEKTWKKNFIDNLVTEMKVTPEIATNVWDSYVIVQLDKTPWQELIEKGKDKLSEEGEKKLTEYLTDKVITDIDDKMLKGKTKEEATKYLNEQAKKAAETRAKDLFSSVTFASDMFWKFADIFSGLNLVEQIKPTLASRMVMVREAAECTNISNSKCARKLNTYYLNNTLLKQKLKQLRGKNAVVNIAPKVGQVLNPASKDDQVISATNTKLDLLKKNAKASFNLDAFSKEHETLKANFNSRAVCYSNYLTASSEIIYDADSTFRAWVIAQKIKPKKAGRIREKIDKWKEKIDGENELFIRQYTDLKQTLLTEQNQKEKKFRLVQKEANKISSFINQGLQSLEKDATNADLGSFNNQKAQILDDLNSIGILISQIKKLPYEFILKVKELACDGSRPNYFWDDGEWETSVVKDAFCDLHISEIMNMTGCEGNKLIIPNKKIHYPKINPGEIYRRIEEAGIKLNQNMTLKLVGRNEEVHQQNGKNEKPAFDSGEQKEVLSALKSTIYMQAANNDMEELKERLEITLSQLEHLASRLKNNEPKINKLNVEQKLATFGSRISHDEIALGLGASTPDDFKMNTQEIVDEYFKLKTNLLISAEDLQDYYQNESLIFLVGSEIDRLDSRGGFYVNSSEKFKLVKRWLDVKEKLEKSAEILKTALENFVFVDKNKIIWQSFSTPHAGYPALEKYCKANNFPEDFLDMNWLLVEENIYGPGFEVKEIPLYSWLTPKQYRRLQNKENYERYSFAWYFSDLFLTTRGDEPIGVEELVSRKKDAEKFIQAFVSLYNNNSKYIPACDEIKNFTQQLNKLEKKIDESLYLAVKEKAKTVIGPLSLLCGKYTIYNQTVSFFTHLLPTCNWYDAWKRYRALQVPGMEYEIKLNGTPVKELQKKWADRNSLKIIGTDPELTISNGDFSERLKNEIVTVELKVCEVPTPDANEIEKYNYKNCISNEMYEIVASGSADFSKKYNMKSQGVVRIYLRIKVKNENENFYFEPYPDGFFVQWWDENQRETPATVETREGEATLEIFSGEGSFQDGYDFAKQAVQRIGENGVNDATLDPDIFYSEKEFIESPDNYIRPKVIDFGAVALNSVSEKPTPTDSRFHPIDFHKSPITQGHTYAMYTKKGKLVLMEILKMYQKPFSDYHINGITFKWKIPGDDVAANSNSNVNTAPINAGINPVNSNTGVQQSPVNQSTIQNIIQSQPQVLVDTNVSSAYNEYIAAYNTLTNIMSQGKGDTPEAQVAYKNYKEKKDYYESLLKGGIPVPPASHTANTQANNQQVVHQNSSSLVIGSNQQSTQTPPIADLKITTVSGGPFQAPVWVQFDLSGSYDPDGQITLFELDKDGDHIFEDREERLHGSSMEFTVPGDYIATLRVTDNSGLVASTTKKFRITGTGQPKNQSDEYDQNNSVWQSHKGSIQQSHRNSNTWQKTSIPWVKVWALNHTAIETKEIDIDTLPPDDFKSISPCISIEPQEDDAIPGAIRVTMPKTVYVAPEDRGRVALAFYEESYSSCTGETVARWRFHAADYNPQTDTWEAQLNHGCFVVWGLVTLGAGVSYLASDDVSRWLMSKKESAHFVLHYQRDKISETTVGSTLDELEASQTFLTGDITRGGLGLIYPSVPAKLDVYYVPIKSKKSVVYGLFQQGKTGAKWLDLNLPSTIPNYDIQILKATLAHELFHFIQFPYEGYSTFRDAWWRKAKQKIVSGNNFPYGWLDEALSSSVELTAVKTFAPDNNSPILNSDLLSKGLNGLTSAKQGYSAGLFINFLVQRYGVAIYSAILNECKRQVESGTPRNPVVAIKRAVVRLARQQQPSDKDWQDIDAVWQSFTDAFIREEPGEPKIDGRLNRKIPFVTPPLYPLTIGENKTIQQWTINVPSLSLNPSEAKIFKITPAKWNDENKAVVECSATFNPGEPLPFDVATSVDFTPRLGKQAFLPLDAISIGKMNRNNTVLPFTLTMEKQNRAYLLSFIPTGLGASITSGKAQGAYQLTCKLHKEETITAPPAIPVSSNAVDAYWWIFWQTAVTIKTSGKSYQEIQPEKCEKFYTSAEEEWNRIGAKVVKLEKQRENIDEEIRPLSDFLDKNDIASFYQQAPGVTDFLLEINNNYGNISEPCYNVKKAGNAFANLSIDWGKRVVVPFTYLINSRSRIVKSTLPTKEEVQKALDEFHKDLSQIDPCQVTLDKWVDYWNKNKDEVLKKINDLKTRFPSLK